MSRIRTVKPEHWNDRELTNIPMAAHLLWIGTWNFSDDKGIFDGDPLLLKSQIFPRRKDVRVEQIIQWLASLIEARYIIPFTYTDGQGYYINRTFGSHQRIDKPQPSKFDPQFIKKLLQEHSGNAPRTFLPVLEGIREESIGGDRPPPKIEFPEMTGNDFIMFQSQLIQDAIFIEQVMLTRKIPDVVTMMNWIKVFSLHISGEGKLRKDFAEYKRHFKNWITKQDTTKQPPIQTETNGTARNGLTAKETEGERILRECGL